MFGKRVCALILIIFFERTGHIFSSYGVYSGCGDLLVVQPTALIQLKFPYTLLHTDYVTTGTTGTATVQATTNFAQLQVTAANSNAVLYSIYRLNYQPGQGNVCMFTAIFNNNGATGGVANSTQLIGVGNFTTNTTPKFTNIQDGFFFGYQGANFGIFQYINSVVTFIPQTAWNVDKMNGTGPSGMTLIQNAGNVYKIQYSWLGFGHINFYIENPATSTLTLVHVIKYGNANTVTSLLNPTLQLMAGVSNTANSSTITLKTPCMTGIAEGYPAADIATRNSVKASSTVASTSSFNNLLTIRNNTTYNTLTNQVLVYLDNLSVMNTGANSFICELVLNPTLNTPTFTNVGINSVVASDSAGTFVANTGKVLLTFFVQRPGGSIVSSNMTLDLSKFGIVLVPGDVLVAVAQGFGGVTTLNISLSWVERF